jgi:hypothetical protein
LYTTTQGEENQKGSRTFTLKMNRLNSLWDSVSSSLSLSSLDLSDTHVYAPGKRALLGTASHFCEVLVLKLRTAPNRSTAVAGLGFEDAGFPALEYRGGAAFWHYDCGG